MNPILRRIRHVAALLVCCAAAAPAFAKAPPAIMRYNTVAESTYLLDRCGELTPERRAWLRKLANIAKRPLRWSDRQRAAHDAALARDFARLYPSVPKVRCDELVRSIDQEMQNPPAN
jgi:hypothetical protein